MRAGKLRHQIGVDKPVESQSNSGETVIAFVPVATVAGSIEPLTGREALLGNQPLATMDTRICLRWVPLIARLNAEWRLRHGDTIYNIVSANNVEMRDREFELMCKSGANRG